MKRPPVLAEYFLSATHLTDTPDTRQLLYTIKLLKAILLVADFITLIINVDHSLWFFQAVENKKTFGIQRFYFTLWSGWWESNPRYQLGRLEFYHWTTPAFTNGRDDTIWTCDPLVPNQVLYQAELRPVNEYSYFKMACPERFELPTFWFVVKRSIRLS